MLGFLAQPKVFRPPVNPGELQIGEAQHYHHSECESHRNVQEAQQQQSWPSNADGDHPMEGPHLTPTPFLANALQNPDSNDTWNYDVLRAPLPPLRKILSPSFEPATPEEGQWKHHQGHH